MGHSDSGRSDGLAARRGVLLAVAALILSACASADVASIQKIPDDQIGNVMVSEVDVAIETPRPHPLLKAALEEKLRELMPKCATGTVPHRMNVAVTDFEDQDVGKAILIGDEIELEGRVELFDAATGTKAGEYYVERSFFWGGFIGAAMMSDAEGRLSQDFAESICEEVFGVDVGDKK